MDETSIPSTTLPDVSPVFVAQSEGAEKLPVDTSGAVDGNVDDMQKGLGTYTANPDVLLNSETSTSAAAILDGRLNPKVDTKVGGEIANPGAMNAILVVSLKAQVENLLTQINDLTTRLTQAKTEGEKMALKATVEIQGQLESLRALLETKDAIIGDHLATIKAKEERINTLELNLKATKGALEEADRLLPPNIEFLKMNPAAIAEEEGSVSTEIPPPLEAEKKNEENFIILTEVVKYLLERLTSCMPWAKNNLNDRASKYTGEQEEPAYIATGDKGNVVEGSAVTDTTVSADSAMEEGNGLGIPPAEGSKNDNEEIVLSAQKVSGEFPAVNVILDQDKEAQVAPQNTSPLNALTSEPEVVVVVPTGDVTTPSVSREQSEIVAEPKEKVTMAVVTSIIIALGHSTGDLGSIKRSIEFPLRVANNDGAVDTGSLTPRVLESLESGTIY
jgi:hypothetical protein